MVKKIKTENITENESINTLSKVLEKVTLIETKLNEKEYDENLNCKEDSRDIVASQFKNCQLIYHICDIFHEFQINKISLTIVCKICALAGKHIHIQSNPYNTDLGVFSY